MDARQLRRVRNIGVGCVTVVAGWFSGAMFAVLIAKVVGSIQGCPSGEEGAPCNWYYYALVGGVIGIVSLPTLVFMRLRQSDRRAELSERGGSGGAR